MILSNSTERNALLIVVIVSYSYTSEWMLVRYEINDIVMYINVYTFPHTLILSKVESFFISHTQRILVIKK